MILAFHIIVLFITGYVLYHTVPALATFDKQGPAIVREVLSRFDMSGLDHITFRPRDIQNLVGAVLLISIAFAGYYFFHSAVLILRAI